MGCLNTTEAPQVFAAPSLHPFPTGTTSPTASHPKPLLLGSHHAVHRAAELLLLLSSPHGCKDMPRNTRVLHKDAAPSRFDPVLSSDGNLELFHLLVQQRCRHGISCVPPACKGSEQRRGKIGYLRGPAVQAVPEGPAGQGGLAVP